MPASPKISVCIATYNRVRRLENLIKLFLGCPFGDFELIVSDDCSSDGTAEMVRALTDPRIRFFRQEKNIGIHPNWDFTARKAQAPVIFRIDDDDYVKPDFPGKVVDFFDRNPEAGSLYTGYAYTTQYDYSSSLQVIDRGVFAGREVAPSDDFLRAFLLHDPFPGVHYAAVAYRRQMAEKIGFYRPDWSDHIFSLALATQAPVGYIPEVLFYYVQHDEARHSSAVKAAGDAYYDPLNLAKSVYEGGFECFDQNAFLKTIREEVYRRHVKIYASIELYTIRRNHHSRALVLKAAARLVREHPILLLHPPFYGALLAMMGPEALLDRLLGFYRNCKWFQKLTQ